MDTSVLPLGERAQRAIVEHVVAVGDEAESRFLEAKSDLDFTATAGIAKIARFLLGASNRLPADAMRQFHGYAVLVVGAGKGAAPGVPRGVEPHDLENRLRPYVGTTFPGFELGRVKVSEDREVILVVGLPPRDGQPMFVCHKDFQGANRQENLESGAVYVRGASNTRKAQAGEMLALIERGQANSRPPVELDMRVGGHVGRIKDVDALIEDAFRFVEDDFTGEPAPSLSDLRSSVLLPSWAGAPVGTSRAQSLERWRRDKPENMARGREHFLGVVLPGIVLTVTTNRFVRAPHLTITFHNCDVLDHLEVKDAAWDELVKPIQEPSLMFPSVRMPVPNIYRNDYPVDWTRVGKDAQVTLTPESFRPNSPWTTDDDDYVLLARDPNAAEVLATWTLTEDGVDTTTTGELRIVLQEPQDAQELLRIHFRH
ncbi:hypothetical protein [Cellulomonas triticagri]|uniref:Uncharacterized protein n=1 Tax=Cellulomonas triticagri TaxID=2483352 RepID=A0A3M2JG52_9CELL|nr:hypothetical protein [Cellulomonas triticagri]RMI12519.1 hypothetical protein EBM89_08395 [Cellulomonas triticagri]